MPLPCANGFPPGTLWQYKGKTHVTDGKSWTRWKEEEDYCPSQFQYATISNYIDMDCQKVLYIQPVEKRGRGRPPKQKPQKVLAQAQAQAKHGQPVPLKPRKATKYILFVQEHMHKGTFAELGGQERLIEIAKLWQEQHEQHEQHE